MKILVENSAYGLENMGDLAMLQVGLSRIQKIFPQAQIYVFTQEADRLVKNCPSVIPILPTGRDAWGWPLIGSFFHTKNNFFGPKWRQVESYFRYRNPKLRSLLIKFKLRHSLDKLDEVEKFTNLMYEIDLVVATGGGYITDAFIGSTPQKLETLYFATKIGKPVAMLGQGIGPLNKHANHEKAKEVLSSVDLIALREKKTSLPLLESMNISHEKVAVTGDDATELAYNNRQSCIGSSIGINLRVASYSNVDQSCLDKIKRVVHSFAGKNKVKLVPVPIERHSSPGIVESDADSIRNLLQGYDDQSDGGKELDSPIKVIKQASDCRLVITGSYHAGVFSLAQGVPVIGLANSQYYVNKFLGLSDQFGGGCKIVCLDSPTLSDDLENTLEQLWEKAEEMRPLLLKSAVEQIEKGHQLYESLPSLLSRD